MVESLRWKEEIAALREILARRYRDSTSEGAGVPLPPAPVVTSTAESGAAPPAVPPAVGSAAAVNSRGNDRTRAPLTPAPFVDLSTAEEHPSMPGPMTGDEFDWLNRITLGTSSLLAVHDSCPACMLPYKLGETLVLLGCCCKAWHESCARRWMTRYHGCCAVCKVRLPTLHADGVQVVTADGEPVV